MQRSVCWVEVQELSHFLLRLSGAGANVGGILLAVKRSVLAVGKDTLNVRHRTQLIPLSPTR